MTDVKNDRGWNPYYLAFCRDTMVEPGSGRHNYQFMEWIGNKKQEYAEKFPNMITDGRYMLGNIIDYKHWGMFLTGEMDEEDYE